MADIDLLKPRELMPKDILQFVEHKAERAIEVLREIIDVGDYYFQDQTLNVQGMQNQASILGNVNTITWNNTGTGSSLVAPNV